MKLFRVMVVSLLFLGRQFAQAKPPVEIQEACTDDAQRLCATKDLLAAAGGSYGAINACFKVNNAKLSARCRAALAKGK